MGRNGIALIASFIVLAGCTSPRVISAEGPELAAAAGWDESSYTDYELGTAPALLAAGEDDPADEAPSKEAPAMEVAPAADKPGADAPAAEVVEFPPCAPRPICPPRCVTVAPAPANGPRLSRCAPSPCPDPCDPCRERGYAGLGFAVGPGYGGIADVGLNIGRIRNATLSVNGRYMWMDLSDDLDGGDDKFRGKLLAFQLGLRARFDRFACCDRLHPTVRLGFGWMQATGRPDLLDLADVDGAGDYVGAYVGLGLDYDLSRKWSTGPEIALFGGWDVDDADNMAWVPTVSWHLTYRF
ncbi:MAG: outer membrane beta-barrel protein [Planctomycetota bacterium]|nr:outer membrane beta-barrel protein [Planctomycetota bacterium]